MFMWKVDAIRTKGLYVPEAVIERADVSNFHNTIFNAK